MNVIGTELRDTINSGLARRRLTVYMATAVDSVANPASKHRFSLSVENERADAGRDDRTCLARTNSQVQTGTGDFSSPFFPFPADRKQD